MMENIFFPIIDLQEHNKDGRKEDQHIKDHKDSLNFMLLIDIITIHDLLKRSD